MKYKNNEFNNISLMNENFTSNNSKNNIKNDEFSLNTEESDYKNLITRLKKISDKISLLEKTITR